MAKWNGEPLIKMRAGELWKSTAQYCVEEVSTVRACHWSHQRGGSEVLESDSYPGMRTVYTPLEVTAKLLVRNMDEQARNLIGLKDRSRPEPDPSPL